MRLAQNAAERDRIWFARKSAFGAIAGEHGVGSEKRQYMRLMFNEGELCAMQDIKDVFDPKNILNPGKIVPEVGAWRPPVSLTTHRAVDAAEYAPRDTADAAEVIQSWTAARRGIRIRGGGTKSGFLPPADVILSTESMSGITAFELNDLFVTVGAGTRLSDLEAALAREKVWTPLASPWPEATIGGIVATNFNAPPRMRYGAVRDLLLAMTVVMPDGRVIRAGKPVVKNVAGYDLPKLFTGSHGTLGLLTEVSLKVLPLPRARQTVVVPVKSLAQGLEIGFKLLRVCLVASSLLLCRGYDLPGLSAPLVLVYTAEGVAEDVAAELKQVRDVLQPARARDTELAGFSGTELWGQRFTTKTLRTLRAQRIPLSSLCASLCPLGLCG